MKFAKVAFAVAGVWGLLVLPPLYFQYDTIGRDAPPPLTHPEFYYGFLGVALAWQIAFLIVASNPLRFRPIMLAAMIEKFSYVIAAGVLYTQGRLQAGPMAYGAIADLVLGMLFVTAYIFTARPQSTPA